MIFNRNVDSILRQFNKTIGNLEKVANKNIDRAETLHAYADVAKLNASEHEEEAKRVLSVKGKLEKLLA